jgi:hypothetical protein
MNYIGCQRINCHMQNLYSKITLSQELLVLNRLIALDNDEVVCLEQCDSSDQPIMVVSYKDQAMLRHINEPMV